MDGILHDLQDPRWWFSGLFFLIVGAFVTGFLKDATSRWLARSFEWYRKRRWMKLAAREEYIAALVSDPVLLSTHNFIALVNIAVVAVSVGFVLYTPIFIELTYTGQSPYFAMTRPKEGHHELYQAFRILQLGLGLVIVFLGYFAMSRFAVTLRVYDILRRQHRLRLREEALQQQDKEDSEIPPSMS